MRKFNLYLDSKDNYYIYKFKNEYYFTNSEDEVVLANNISRPYNDYHFHFDWKSYIDPKTVKLGNIILFNHFKIGHKFENLQN